MHAYQLSMLGLVLDIIGAFFLAVEAIKLQNLEKLRDRFLIPLHVHLRPRPYAAIGDDIDPREPITTGASVADEIGEMPAHQEKTTGSVEPNSARSGKRRESFAVSFLLWFFWHFVGGALPTALALFLLRSATGFDLIAYLWAARMYLPELVRVPITAYAILCFVAMVACFPGEAMHRGAIRMSGLAVNFLFWIDRRTPDGTIGILGFSLLLLGFTGQLLGTWLGRPPPH